MRHYQPMITTCIQPQLVRMSWRGKTIFAPYSLRPNYTSSLDHQEEVYVYVHYSDYAKWHAGQAGSGAASGVALTACAKLRGYKAMNKQILPTDQIVTGYKATGANMYCRDYQFTLGEWHRYVGKIAICRSGFHFCEYPSGPWAYYCAEGTRVFKVEARGVIKSTGPGADLRHVAQEIRLVEEIFSTGDGNATNRHTGYFCMKEPPLVIFDEPVPSTSVDGRLINELAKRMASDEPIENVEEYLDIPNATLKKIQAVHQVHIDRRKKAGGAA